MRVFDLLRRRGVAFILLVLSSLGFSFGLILVRFLGEREAIAYSVNFQSTLVLLSFFLQLGFRACLRYEYFRNHRRLVATMEGLLLLLLVVVGIMFLFLFPIGDGWFFSTASLLAFLTLKQVLSVVSDCASKQFYYALSIFFLCASGSLLTFFPIDDQVKNSVLEVSSLLVLFLFSFYYLLSGRFEFRRWRIFIHFIIRSQSFQLGSGIGYLFGFILAQSVLSRYGAGPVITAYADIQILAGVVALLFGKLIMLVEGGFYDERSKNHLIFASLCGAWTLISVFVALFVSFVHSGYFFFLFFACSILLSKLLIGFFVQYMQGARFWLNCFLLFVCMAQGGLYFLDVDLIYQYFLVALVLVVGFFFLYRSPRVG